MLQRNVRQGKKKQNVFPKYPGLLVIEFSVVNTQSEHDRIMQQLALDRKEMEQKEFRDLHAKEVTLMYNKY